MANGQGHIYDRSYSMFLGRFDRFDAGKDDDKQKNLCHVRVFVNRVAFHLKSSILNLTDFFNWVKRLIQNRAFEGIFFYSKPNRSTPKVSS